MKKRCYIWLGILVLFGLLMAGKDCKRELPNHSRTNPEQPRTAHADDGEGVKALPKPMGTATWSPNAEDVRAVNETEAVFFGKVIDQFGAPVPGAEIKAERKLSDEGTLTENSFTRTGADGKFSIRQKNSPTLSIGVVIPSGYYPAGENTRQFVFSQIPPSFPIEHRKVFLPPHQADPNNPVIFKLNKMGRTEPMIHRSESAVASNNREFTVGAEAKHRLNLKFWKDPTVARMDPTTGQPFYDWGAEITVPSGGIIERTDPDAYEAPKQGYKDLIRLEYSSEMAAKDYRRSIQQQFFIRFTDGRYGRIEVRLNSLPTRPFVTVESWFNPSGSTATEYDTSKSIPLKAEQ